MALLVLDVFAIVRLDLGVSVGEELLMFGGFFGAAVFLAKIWLRGIVRRLN